MIAPVKTVWRYAKNTFWAVGILAALIGLAYFIAAWLSEVPYAVEIR